MKKTIALFVIIVILLILPSCSENTDGSQNRNATPASSFKYIVNDTVRITEYIGDETNVVIPAEIEGRPVTQLYGFACTRITSVYIPDSVTRIVQRTFSHCAHLETVTFEQGLKTIETCAFENCTALKSITLPDSLEEMGNYVFSECTSLEEVFLPKSLKAVGQYPFNLDSSLKTVTFEEGTTRIFDGCFFHCNAIEAVTVPASVSEIGGAAFGSCEKLRDVYFEGDAPEKIGKNVFKYKLEEKSPVILHYRSTAAGWDSTPLKDEYGLEVYEKQEN